MGNVRIELNHTEIARLLKSEDMMKEMKRVADSMPGKIEKEYVGIDRVHVVVKEDQ